MTDTPRIWLTRALAAVLLVTGAATLTGCAALRSVTSEVSSYGHWPAGRLPGTYAFERLPSQQVDSPLQVNIEAAAAPALAAAGFKPAANPLAADVLVQVAMQSRVYQSPWRDRWGPYGPYGRIGFGSWHGGGGRFGFGLGMSLEPPMSEMQVDLLIRDKKTNQVLYETHAVRQQNGGWDERLMAPMFEAALKDFPLQAISPRIVSIPLKPKDAEAPKQ
jgi:uncharacterized protein DUF4136